MMDSPYQSNNQLSQVLQLSTLSPQIGKHIDVDKTKDLIKNIMENDRPQQIRQKIIAQYQPVINQKRQD
jgi:hypothetical protein